MGEPKEVNVKQGEGFNLMCQVDGWYEWCTFKHNGKVCDFEYKYSLGDVTTLECDSFAGRSKFQGIYKSSECGIVITNATGEDTGEWTCEIEEYWSGKTRNYGSKVTGSMQVNVEVPTTTTTTTITTTTTTTTVESTTTTSEEIPDYNPDEDTEDVTDPETETTETVDPSQEPQIDPAKDDSLPIIPIVVAVCVAILIGGLALIFGLHYKRKLHPCFYRIVS